MRFTKLASMVMVLALLCMVASVQTVMAQSEGDEASLGVVQTEYGLARGVEGELDGITMFKGIPYAAPPVGDLRWMPPQAPESWSGARVFNTYPDACMMYTFDGDMNAEPWKSDFYYEELPALSEDCLYLNVTTSAVAGDEKLPVFVWYHGGGLRHGYAWEVEFNPNVLANKGVVVVTVGQRLGVFGYMSLPQLSAESDYGGSGNYGLMDQIKAMEWIRDNIAAFGGDPENVTVGGQSGGASKSAALFVSEPARGLADKLIMQSGLQLTGTYLPLADAEARGVTWLQHLGLNGDDSLADLRATDARFFLGQNYPDYQSMAPASMNQDGQYITVGGVREAWEAGALEGVDIIVGTALGEASYDAEIANAEGFYASFQEMLGDFFTEYDFENLVWVANANARDMARTLASYGLTTAASRNVTLNQLFGATPAFDTGDVYVYLFSHRAPGRNEDVFWAWHSSDLWYSFASLRDIPEQREWEEWDYELAETMSSYWANFMKSGDPNGGELPTWQPSTQDALAYMEFGDELFLDTEISQVDQLMIDWNRVQFELE